MFDNKMELISPILTEYDSHQQTGSLLLQYEKTLEAELEKRQDSYNQDM